LKLTFSAFLGIGIFSSRLLLFCIVAASIHKGSYIKWDGAQGYKQCISGIRPDYRSQYYLDIESLWALLLEFGVWSLLKGMKFWLSLQVLEFANLESGESYTILLLVSDNIFAVLVSKSLTFSRCLLINCQID
jgi:hypothetical protein